MKVSLSIVVTALVGLVLASAADAATIAFADNRDGDSDVYLVRTDGSGRVKLTHNRAQDSQPAWSPDGRSIVFVSDRDGDEELYVMRADGSRVRQLTHNGAADNLPAWSPNGREIAYASTARGGQFDIYVIHADGTDRRRLTWVRGAFDYAPAWSPDGTRIAFASDRAGEGNTEVFTMRPDGKDVRRVTRTGGDFEFPQDDSFPAWSPDGGTLLFETNRDGTVDLWTIAPDGSDEAPLLQVPAADESQPSYGPSGARILFASFTFANPPVIQIANADGSNVRTLVRGTSASWRPRPAG